MDPEQENTNTGQQPGSNRTKIITTVAVLLVAVLMVVGIKAFSGKSDSKSSAANMSAASSDTKSDSSKESTNDNSQAYKDGTYDATGSYVTPGSTEKIDVTLTLKDGKITDANVTTDPQARESREWQERFLSGYKQLVIGKTINDLKLSRVSGSSLTPNGFNNAIDSIKSQAKS